jgi:23S rRNA A2030 N6-methylase RlmJ
MIEQIEQTHRGRFNVEGSLQVRTGEATTGIHRKWQVLPWPREPFPLVDLDPIAEDSDRNM